MSYKQTISIPKQTLKWIKWRSWNSLDIDLRKTQNKSKAPPPSAGVYKVREIRYNEIIYIGHSNDLDRRIRKALVRGTYDHCNRNDILKKNPPNKLEISWSITDRPKAIEEHLLIEYKANNKSNSYPEFVKKI